MYRKNARKTESCLEAADVYESGECHGDLVEAVVV